VTAYPEHVLQRAYAWMRGHPVAADGMLGGAGTHRRDDRTARARVMRVVTAEDAAVMRDGLAAIRCMAP
jgi:hypothetical protein